MPKPSRMPPLKPSWVRDFSPNPSRVYHGETPLGESDQRAKESSDAIKKARAERAPKKGT